MMKLPASTGCENPASAQMVEIKSKQSTRMPEAVMAGSMKRKIPGDQWAGSACAGTQEQVAVRGGKALSKAGYSVISASATPRSPAAKSNTTEKPVRAAQSVKGAKGKRAPAESRSVSGRS